MCVEGGSNLLCNFHCNYFPTCLVQNIAIPHKGSMVALWEHCYVMDWKSWTWFVLTKFFSGFLVSTNQVHHFRSVM